MSLPMMVCGSNKTPAFSIRETVAALEEIEIYAYEDCRAKHSSAKIYSID